MDKLGKREYDYLIVELKRPSKKIDDEVLSQIKKYANAVASDERFRDVPTRWTFVAISNDMDAFAKSEANQRNRPKGLVSDNADLNMTVWAKTWAEVINDARTRLRFVNEQLAYQADKGSVARMQCNGIRGSWRSVECWDNFCTLTGAPGFHPQGVGRGCKGLKPQQPRTAALHPSYVTDHDPTIVPP